VSILVRTIAASITIKSRWQENVERVLQTWRVLFRIGNRQRDEARGRERRSGDAGIEEA
jgi:hypothetical protein